MRILLLEPFYGGSHRDVVDNLLATSTHQITVITLSARHWKWRMRGSGLHFAHTVRDHNPYDLVVATGMTTITDFMFQWGAAMPPVALFVHETQLTYPVPPGETPDLHLAFTDVQNLVAAESVRFNSEVHLSGFLHNLEQFLRKMPRPRLSWVVDEIRTKSRVLYPGIRVPGGSPSANRVPLATHDIAGDDGVADRPLVVWNHRWEFDKAPEVFFAALGRAKARGVSFSLAILGENVQVHPSAFEDARDTFDKEIVQFGYVADRDEYEQWLLRGDIVVSTAIQENFGISVLEAVAAGCFPLLPDRLSYPEIVPVQLHPMCLYRGEAELSDRLVRLLGDREARRLPPELQEHARSFSWQNRVAKWDAWMTDVAEGREHGKA
ncbi:MAG: DUF3524 domain-containing protein [Spirochaetales bacterium]